MDFYWNAFGWVNLGLDMAITGSLFGLIYINRRIQSTRSLITICRQAVLGVFLLWVCCGLFVGGIIGFSLIARTFWIVITVGAPILLIYYSRRLKKNVLLIPAMLLIGLKVYGEVYEPGALEVQRAVVGVRGLKAPLKIAHISDLQTDGIGSMQERALETVNNYKPDLILFTGDVMNHPSLGAEIHSYLGRFKSRYGAFFVDGNVDTQLNIPELFRGTDFENLAGKYKRIETSAGTIGVVGLTLDDFGFRKGLEDLLSKLGHTDVTLLLSHVPDAMRITDGLPISFLFSGHTHGGQACLPWVGPLVTLSGVPRTIAAGGIHKVGALNVVVSRGLGMEGHIAPRIRTFCRPQVLLLELKPL